MSARLATWLIDERVLPEGVVETAAARQLVYGGALDTALLEMAAMTEAAIWARLSAATGLPVPPPALCDGQMAEIPPSLNAQRTGRLRVVPVAAEAGTLKLLCAEPVAIDEITAAAAAGGFAARLYVVPEVRLLAARQRVYGEPLSGRYAPLLARILGAERIRKDRSAPRAVPPPPAQPLPAQSRRPSIETAASGGGATTPLGHVMDLSGPLPADSSLEIEFEFEAGAQPLTPMAEPPSGPVRLELVSALSPTPSASPEPSGDARSSAVTAPAPDGAPDGALDGAPDSAGHPATEALCRRARNPHDRGRTLALRALRRRLAHPAVQGLLAALRREASAGDVTEAIDAILALAELRDETMIPNLIQGLDRATPPDVAEAIQHALVALSAQDFGRSRRRWQAWARRNIQRPRTEWLLEGLGHKQPEIRRAASEELRQLSGDSFGYLFDLPKRERENARRQWSSWWQAVRGQVADAALDGALSGPADDTPVPPLPPASKAR